MLRLTGLLIGIVLMNQTLHALVKTELCLAPVDIILVLDSSSSMGTEHYAQQLQFAADLTQGFQLGPSSAQFGAVVFSHSVTKLFDLKNISDHESLSATLLAAPYHSTSTYTHQALRFVHYDGMFDTDAGGRDDAADVLILLTDGRSNRVSRTLAAADQLKAQNVTIMTVGVGPDISDGELENVASSPEHVFKAPHFDTLDSIKNRVVKKTCEVAELQTEGDNQKDEDVRKDVKEDTMCLIPADIVLVIDSSSSIGQTHYTKQLQFAAELTAQFLLGPLSSRFAALVFSHRPEKLFDLKDYQDSQSLATALLAAPHHNSSTYTHLAMWFIYYDGMFDTDAGGRDDAADVLILLTDGKSNRMSRTITAAETLKNQNVTIVTVGIGDDVSEDELEVVASSPQDVFKVTGFDILDSIKAQVAQHVCKNLDLIWFHQIQRTNVVTATLRRVAEDAHSSDNNGNADTEKRECVADSSEGCQDLPNGDYPACHPYCQEGIYITCSSGYRYERDCGLGWYKSPEGNVFAAKLVYDPDLKSCEIKTSHCPRALDEQIVVKAV